MPISRASGRSRADGVGGDIGQVYTRLRQAILVGTYQPGDIINQVHVAREMGVSRTPVREALRLLQAEGLIDAQFQRRMRVTAVKADEVDETNNVAIGGGETATWEQAGTAAWQALTDLAPTLQQQPAPNMLPLVRLDNTKSMQFKRGSTISPVLEVIKWVPRPDCMKEGAAGGIALDPAPAPAPAPKPAPAPAPVSDDMEF
jgi:DNA-binding transcriptional MocR family regulator